jgi:hypothetical protein
VTIGLGAAGWALVRRGPTDALFMLLVWPLYAPFLCVPAEAGPVDELRARLARVDRLLAQPAARRHVERLTALRAQIAARLGEAAEDEVEELLARLEAEEEVDPVAR